MTAEVIAQDKDGILIQWESEKGFGQLLMKWDQEMGRFILDSEMMGVQHVIDVFKAIEQ